ncbi:MAG: tyrosine-type recombinase/integrase, partial [Actinomycetota bacterium]|nr:tyrosine-type recombinase/integrase [Actinomycetota bacterium]
LRAASWRSRFWRPAVRLAALEPFRPHDLGHTAVALWIAAGIGVLEVSRLAGHTSTSFTLDRYGHLFPQSERQSAAKLDRYLADLPVARISHDVGTEDVAQGGT